MKKLKTLVSLLAAVALLLMIPGANSMQASAEEPVTYFLKYVEEKGEWRFHIGAWDDNNAGHRELYYLKEAIKDGDLIVIEGGDHGLTLELPVNLNNITFNHSYSATITAKSVENVYVLRDSVAAVNGDVVNAHVYDNAVVNFNNNVTNLYITKERSGEQSISVIGTVGFVQTGDAEKVYNQFYNFQANSFRQEKGILKTDASLYSTTPVAAPPAEQPVAPATPEVPAAPATPVTPTADSEYDDVPKTGDTLALPYMLFAAAAFCFGSVYLLRKKKA
ncbi:MAG: LPXTG cell wall anchor domain-containing protein [Acetatifactor sp.]|nr:LPXTG cell wall anchor domain-containing protein [Acetatifactor sp.]